jgi:SAM-dependent methyltransferase
VPSESKTMRRRGGYALAVAGDLALRASRRLVAEGGETLEGDRWVEWSFCLARLAEGEGTTLDFGADIGFLSLAAAQRGHEVVALDREPAELPYEHPRVTALQADVLERPLADQRFDQIINCSSVEHVGLEGRYGSFAAADGDIEAMTVLAERLAPGGRMILTIPVGRDRLCAPLHRIYGVERLPRLLGPFEIAEEQFWHKQDGGWRATTRETALETEGSETLYALGLFVLRSAG